MMVYIENYLIALLVSFIYLIIPLIIVKIIAFLYSVKNKVQLNSLVEICFIFYG